MTPSPSTNIVNSVLAGTCDGVAPSASGGDVDEINHSGTYTCNFTGSSKHVHALSLGALADNGGPTQTRLPGAGSDVIGAAGPAYCAYFDQRGFVRTASGVCDAGAVQTTAIDDVILRDGFELH